MEYYVSGGQAYQPDQLAHWLIQQCFGISLPRPTYVSPFAAYPPLPVGDIPTRLRQLKQPGKEITLNHAIRIRNVSNRGGEKQHYFVLANRRLIVYNVLHRSYHFQYYFEGFVHQQLRQGNQLLNYTTYAPQPAQPNDLEQITKAIYQSFAYLPGETASRLRAMLTPEAIAGIAGFAALYLASQVTPIGWIADALGVGLFVWGVWVMGSEILEAAKLLKSFYQTATNARTDSDYQQAGKYFAQAISLIGVDTLMIILGNKAMKAAKPRVVRMMKGGAGEAPGSGTKPIVEKIAAPVATTVAELKTAATTRRLNFQEAKKVLFDPEKIAADRSKYELKKKNKPTEIRPEQEWRIGYDKTVNGHLAEYQVDTKLSERGLAKINDNAKLTSIDKKPKSSGLDGVWKNSSPPPDYYFTETKSAGAKLEPGQMSNNWIENNILKAKDISAGEKVALRDALKGNNGKTAEKVLCQIDEKGSTSFKVLNDKGKLTGQIFNW